MVWRGVNREKRQRLFYILIDKMPWKLIICINKQFGNGAHQLKRQTPDFMAGVAAARGFHILWCQATVGWDLKRAFPDEGESVHSPENALPLTCHHNFVSRRSMRSMVAAMVLGAFPHKPHLGNPRIKEGGLIFVCLVIGVLVLLKAHRSCIYGNI